MASDRPIQVGDLVMVVRVEHACAFWMLGLPFTVTGFRRQTGGGWHCAKCNTYNLFPSASVGVLGCGKAAPPPWWLIRIDPHAEQEARKTDREVTV